MDSHKFSIILLILIFTLFATFIASSENSCISKNIPTTSEAQCCQDLFLKRIFSPEENSFSDRYVCCSENECASPSGCSAEGTSISSYVCQNGQWRSTQTLSEDTEIGGGPIVSPSEATVCCEKTTSGLFCQDAKPESCDSSASVFPTSCEQTSLCRTGWCFDSIEGTCLPNVPQKSCSQSGGQWTEEKPPACELGCCFIGEEAMYTTLTRCKAVSGYYGVEMKYDPSYKSEALCIAAAGSQTKGACVYIEDNQRTCKITTEEDCNSNTQQQTTSSQGTPQNNLGLVPSSDSNPDTNSQTTPQENSQNNSSNDTVQQSPNVAGFENDAGCGKPYCFYPGKLCTAENLETNCAPTKETICVDGKQEVYFKDSCGNPANIYDASRIKDKSYWTNIVKKEDSCNPSSSNANSQTCGNCNYIYGAYCRKADDKTANPTYGDYICGDLNCKASDMTGGVERKHGESWCISDAQLQPTGFSGNFMQGWIPVGTEFYRLRCSNGEVLVEQCDAFRQTYCVENSRETSQGKFTEAACVPNKWQDCTQQTNKEDCLNSDKRNCIWLDGIEYVIMGAAQSSGNGSSAGAALSKQSLQSYKEKVKKLGGVKNVPRGACVPKIPPGLQHWSDSGTQMCSMANAVCPVTYQKGLMGGDWECADDACKLCDPQENPSIVAKRMQVCRAMGDCGLNVNFKGDLGRNKEGYKIDRKKYK